jgi:hypothetical protein
MSDHALSTSASAPVSSQPPPINMYNGYGGGMMNPQIHAMMAIYTRTNQWTNEGVIGYVSAQNAINRAISCCKCQ